MPLEGSVAYKAPFVLKRDFSPNFPLRLLYKDLRLALDAAREVRVKLPGLETVEEIYEVAAEDGHGLFAIAAPQEHEDPGTSGYFGNVHFCLLITELLHTAPTGPASLTS